MSTSEGAAKTTGTPSDDVALRRSPEPGTPLTQDPSPAPQPPGSSGEQPPADRSRQGAVTAVERAYFAAVGVLAAWVGLQAFLAPAQVDAVLPFAVPPLHARLIGAMYLSGLTIMVGGLFARRWGEIRVVPAITAIWTGGCCSSRCCTAISTIFLRPQDTATSFAWPIQPEVMAASLGAFYLASALIFVLPLFATDWQQVRVMILAPSPPRHHDDDRPAVALAVQLVRFADQVDWSATALWVLLTDLVVVAAVCMYLWFAVAHRRVDTSAGVR